MHKRWVAYYYYYYYYYYFKTHNCNCKHYFLHVKGLQEVQNCSSATNRKCVCQPGKFCHMGFNDPYCSACSTYKLCRVGHGVSVPGTATDFFLIVTVCVFNIHIILKYFVSKVHIIVPMFKWRYCNIISVIAVTIFILSNLIISIILSTTCYIQLELGKYQYNIDIICAGRSIQIFYLSKSRNTTIQKYS